MAIKLASAIGEQRKPIDVLGGLGDTIGKTGDAIIKGINDKNERERKKAEQDQKLKDLLASNTKITPPERAVPEQAAEYETFAKEGDFQIRKASLDPKTTLAQLEKMQSDFLYALKERKNKYEKDYDTIHNVSDLAINKGTHDDVLFQNFLIGKENPTKVAEMANDDFMAASEADRAGKMVGENGMQTTETKTNYQGQNYFKLPFEEQKKIDLAEKANRLVTQRVPGIEPAAKAYLGKDLDFKSYTEKLDKVDPKTGQFIYTFKEEDVNRDADRFASSMVGEGNFGSKDHYLQQKAYETAAIKAAVDAGIPQEKMAEAVKEFVQVVAKEDFKRAAQTAYENRIKDQKEIEKAPRGKGLEINNNLGNGGVETPDGVFIKKESTNISDESFAKAYDARKEEVFTRWKEREKALNPKRYETLTNDDLVAMHDAELAKKSKNDPSLTIEERNKKQLKTELNNAKKGLTAISFTPKGKDNWFSAKTTDGKLRKVIPSTVYVDNNGNVVEVEGYNVNEGSTDIKQDLEVFTVDTKDEANKNSFFGKYPTSIKGIKDVAGVDVKAGKVVVEGKAGVGAVNKSQPKAKEEMYIYNGKAYPKSKLEQQGWDISKLKKAQ